MRKFFMWRPTVLFTDERRDRVEITEYHPVTGKIKRCFEMSAAEAARAGYKVPGRKETPIKTGDGVGWKPGMAAPIMARGARA